jgi:type I restriction enzyme, S subunit
VNLITDEFELRPFEKVALPQSDKGKRIKQRDYLPFGKLPVVDQGQSDIGGYTDDEEMCFSGSLPVVIFGDHTRAVKLVNHPFAVGADGIKIFSPAADVLPKYLYYWMKSAPIENRGYGRHYQYLRKLSVPVPSLAKQQAIVDEIEKQFSRLDEAVANLQHVKANLKRYKASVLKAAVEGRLVETESGWRQLKLGEIALSVRNGYSQKPDSESGTRIFRISAVRPMELAVDDVRFLSGQPVEYGNFLVGAGDVLFTRYNGSRDYVGVCVVVPSGLPPTVYPDKLIRVRVPHDQLLPAFLVIAASTGKGRDFIESMIRTTAGQSGVSGTDIKAIPLSIPSMADQARIVDEVDRHLSNIREVEAGVDANLQRAQALRRAVLTRAFSPCSAGVL